MKNENAKTHLNGSFKAPATVKAVEPSTEHVINYRAGGRLIGSCHLRDNRFLIMVISGANVVVSKYINGQSEWCNGSYFRIESGDVALAKKKAFARFAELFNKA